MISKVILIGDPYRGEQAPNIERIKGLFAPLLRQLGVEVQTCITEINCNMDRDVWIPIWEKSLATYPEFVTASLNLENTAVIGFEIPESELNYLNECNLPWINFCIHPLRFLDDLYLDVTTSFNYDMHNMKASPGLIDFCTEAIKLSSPSPLNNIRQKTLLICGQVWFDRSVYFDGKFRSLEDYLPQLDILVQQYERVLYKPHPAFESEKITEIIVQRYHAQNCANINTYDLFSSGEVHTVCAISSSVLSEAPYFGVQAIFLEPQAKCYGSAINYRSLLDNADFWERGLLGRHKVGNDLNFSTIVPPNYLRKIFGSWAFCTEEMRLQQRLEIVEVKVQKAQQSAQNLENMLRDIYASTSWRITAPLRWFGEQVRQLCQKSSRSR